MGPVPTSFMIPCSTVHLRERSAPEMSPQRGFARVGGKITVRTKSDLDEVKVGSRHVKPGWVWESRSRSDEDEEG